MSAKKVAKKTRLASKKSKSSSLIEKLEDTVISQPIAIANKAFLASLGLAVTIQSDFSKRVDELAKDGEVVRDEYQASFDKFRDGLVNQAKENRDRALGRARSFAKFVADSFPLATDDDVQELEQKLDKVLVEVAK